MTTPAQPGRTRKGLSPTTWIIIVLGGALAGGAFLLWRRSQQAAASTAATTGTTTPDTTDFSGEIATLQAEIADLQSSTAQDESSESGGTTTSGGSTGTLAAPGLSVTPHVGGADFGWNAVPGASAYELMVTGAGGTGTGTSHYDHIGTTTHAEKVPLAKGKYTAKVRAGTNTTALTGPWSAPKAFTVPSSQPVAGPKSGASQGKGKPTPGKEPED